MKEKRNYLPLLLRWLHITKPIELSENEVKWIKLCKGHYRELYPDGNGEWTDSLKPMFKEIYGYDPNEFYDEFLNCIFCKLLDIWFKIYEDHSGSDRRMKDVFNAAFYKSISRDQDKPIERAIGELCGQIQNTKVIENGVKRFHLD